MEEEYKWGRQRNLIKNNHGDIYTQNETLTQTLTVASKSLSVTSTLKLLVITFYRSVIKSSGLRLFSRRVEDLMSYCILLMQCLIMAATVADMSTQAATWITGKSNPTSEI